MLLALTAALAAPARAAQDFDGDGNPDLAVGIPGEDFGGVSEAGAIQILRGAWYGLTWFGNDFITGGMLGVDAAEWNDRFGSALAWGDFDHDGYDDLAIGTPYEDVGTWFGNQIDAGAVTILYGSPSGFAPGRTQWIHHDTVGVPGGAGAGDRLGWALAAGDFNGDGRSDLAIGAPYDDIYGSDEGSVTILWGSSSGLSTFGGQFWHQSAFAGEAAENGDRFGYNLLAGNFSSLYYLDLAVGVPGEDLGGILDAGGVQVLYASGPGGLSASGAQFWTQDGFGVLDVAESYDQFGLALGQGDFDGNGVRDLAVGVPYEDLGNAYDAGGVAVFYGSAAGLSASGNQFWTQDSSGIADVAEPNDYFGWSLAGLDHYGDSRDELAIGCIREDVGRAADAGVVHILTGAAAGLTGAGSQLWSQSTSTVAVPDFAESGDHFGYALTALDFPYQLHDSLIVSAIGESFGFGTVPFAGAVHVMSGANGQEFWHQDAEGMPDAAEFGDEFGRALSR